MIHVITRLALFAATVCSSFAISAVCVAADSAEKSVEAIYQEARQAAVEVLVDGHLGGSGCFVEPSGLIVTAAHVLDRPGRDIEVLISDGSRIPARFIAADLGHDLVLLRVEPREGQYAALPLAAELPAAGRECFLVGSPVYRHGLIQRGMVARSELTFEHQSHFVEVLQIAAAVQDGTSGGAWLNRQGEIIGVQSGSITSKDHPAGIANVSPVTAIRWLVETKRNRATPTIGAFVDELWIQQPDQLQRFAPRTEGVIVQQLDADGPAARAGLKRGEVIVAVDDMPVRFRDDFVRSIRRKAPGDSVRVSVVGPDGTGNREVTIPLGCLEVAWPDASDEEQSDTQTNSSDDSD